MDEIRLKKAFVASVRSGKNPIIPCRILQLQLRNEHSFYAKIPRQFLCLLKT